MPGGSTVVDVTYDDPRTGQRIRERRIQEIPDDEIDYVRRRERELVLAPRRPDNEVYYERYERRNDSYSDRGARDNAYLGVNDNSSRRARSQRGDSSRRRSPSSSSQSSSDSSRRRRNRRGHRRARSARDGRGRQEDVDDDGILWYSGKPRKDGNFLEKHFDSSYDGLFAAAAGAAIGAMTVRRFAQAEGDDQNKKNWKTWGGAVAGAAAFNCAENHYRVFTEEKLERKKEHIKEDLKDLVS